jgi:hypothetical protein
MNKKKNILLRGRFTPFDIYLLQTCFILIVILILLYQILSSDASLLDIGNIESILCLFAFTALFAFMYWVLSERYFYYEFSKDRLTVRNVLKKHQHNFFYTDIIKIIFIGKIEYPFIYKNTIHIIFRENNIKKSCDYQSIQLETKDWIDFFKIARSLNIVWEDSDQQNLTYIENHLE